MRCRAVSCKPFYRIDSAPRAHSAHSGIVIAGCGTDACAFRSVIDIIGNIFVRIAANLILQNIITGFNIRQIFMIRSHAGIHYRDFSVRIDIDTVGIQKFECLKKFYVGICKNNSAKIGIGIMIVGGSGIVQMPLLAEIRILRYTYRYRMESGFAKHVGEGVAVAVFHDFFGNFNAVALDGEGVKRISRKDFRKFHSVFFFHVFERFFTAPENRSFGNGRRSAEKIDGKGIPVFPAADERVDITPGGYAVNFAFLFGSILCFGFDGTQIFGFFNRNACSVAVEKFCAVQ